MGTESINWLAVLCASISAIVMGGVWYSPALFGNSWLRENRFMVEQIRARNPIWLLLLAIIFTFIMAGITGLCLATASNMQLLKVSMTMGALMGLVLGGIAFSGLTIVAIFEMKSVIYILINGGYLVLSLILMGAILGLWQ